MAEIAINQGQWDSIKPEEQKKILEGLIKSGSLQEGDTIVGDPNVSTDSSQGWDPIGDLCRAACDVAAGAAAAWCTANTAGTGLAVCLAAASVARNECRKRC